MNTPRLFLALLCALSISATQPSEPPKSAPAIAAERRYAEAMEKAREEFTRMAVPADRKRVADLEAAQQAALAKKDAREVARIDALLAEARAQLAEHTAGSAPGAYVGTWEVAYCNGVRRTYTIAANGTVDFHNERKRGTLRNGLLDLGENNIEVVTPVGDRLLIEHFHPRETYPKGQPILAIATRGR